MKRTIIITAAAFAASLAASGAFAQNAMPSQATDPVLPRPEAAGVPTNNSMGSPMSVGGSMSGSTAVNRSMMPAPSAVSAGVNASATAMAPQTVLLDSSTPGATLVSSPPVPDTAENRARYGGPESNGGRRTAPAAN